MRFLRWPKRLHRLVESSPVILERHRIYVLPTGAGAAYGAALLVMLIASINYNLSLGYGLVFLLASVALLSAVHTFRNLIGLSVAVRPIKPVFAGEKAQFKLTIHNARPYSRIALHALSGENTAVFHLAARCSHEITLTKASRRRGWLQMPRLTLQTTYPLGLFRAWSTLRPDSQVLIYPATDEHARCAISSSRGSGADGAADLDGHEDFAGLRAHRPADSPRHIAWKTAAGGRPLMTKQFHGEAANTLTLDWYALPANLNADARAARLADRLVKAEKAERPYALRLPGQEWAAARGTAHARQCLKALALVDNPEPVHG